jgi:hypothetical protein
VAKRPRRRLPPSDHRAVRLKTGIEPSPAGGPASGHGMLSGALGAGVTRANRSSWFAVSGTRETWTDIHSSAAIGSNSRWASTTARPACLSIRRIRLQPNSACITMRSAGVPAELIVERRRMSKRVVRRGRSAGSDEVAHRRRPSRACCPSRTGRLSVARHWSAWGRWLRGSERTRDVGPWFSLWVVAMWMSPVSGGGRARCRDW